MNDYLPNKITTSFQPLIQLILTLLRPRSTDMEEAFHERNIRVVTITGLTLIAMLFIASIPYTGVVHIEWYISLYAIGFFTFYALHKGKVLLAGRILTLISLVVLIDPSVTYWSPGTVLMGIIFTFAFLLILPANRTLIIPIAANIGIYTLVIFSSEGESPLIFLDFYSTPFMAWLTTLVGHMVIVMLGLYIRHDQQERDRRALLLETQHKESLQQFMNNISHDLNTPLTTIKTSIYLLSKKSTEDQQRNIASLEKQTQHLEELVSSILEMSQLDMKVEFTVMPFNINQTIQSAVNRYQEQASKKGIKLQLQDEEIASPMNGNPELIFRALGHIIENAITFTKEGGLITICLKRIGMYVCIEVVDSGVGIGQEHLPRIFERFYRADSARNTGTGHCGLGLSITKTIVDLHQGKIAVHSEVDKGTQVSILLPAI